jgi:hypothetical protein
MTVPQVGRRIDQKPPTDIQLNNLPRAAPNRADLERQINAAERRRWTAIELRQEAMRAAPAPLAEGEEVPLVTMWVKPADPLIMVPDGMGGQYPEDGVEVGVEDIWANRRIRDGSMVTFQPPPSITSVSPNTGIAGAAVTIAGLGFTGATTVTFGATPATSVVVTNDATITCVAPAGAPGLVPVAVTTPNGTGTLTDGFTYTALARDEAGPAAAPQPAPAPGQQPAPEAQPAPQPAPPPAE